MSSELLFYANVQHDISLIEPSLKYLNEFIEQKSKLNKKERNLFGLIYKDAIDPIRCNLRVFKSYIMNESEDSEILTFLQDHYNKALCDLNNKCNQALDLIKEKLLDAAESASAKAFFHKMSGDIYRYMNEFEEDNKELLNNADLEYNKAITIANTNLSYGHPVRLGSILNYAVFLFEHCQNREKAIDIIKNSLAEVANDTTTLSLSNQKETVDIINTMQKNLEYWNPVSSSSDDEEEN